MEKTILLIDDVRDRKEAGATHIARTYDVALNLLKTRDWDVVSLDFDLGTGKSGMDIIDWFSDHLDRIPEDLVVHSTHPKAREMRQKVSALMAMRRRMIQKNQETKELVEQEA